MSTASKTSAASQRPSAKASTAKKTATPTTEDATPVLITDLTVPPAAEVTTDTRIDLEASPSARRLVAAEHSAPERSEARPPRGAVAAAAAPIVAEVSAPVTTEQHETPASEESPASEDAPVAEDAAAVEEAPVADEAAVTDAPSSDDDAPLSEEAADDAHPMSDDQVAHDASATAVVDSGAVDAADDADRPEAVHIRGLVKRFGDTTAVDGIDLTVPAGSFYGLVGPNGAGKTTTLSIISGLLRPDAGTVHISGIDQRAEPLAAKRVMGVLPDRLRAFDRLTGRQLLFYYGQLRGLKRAVIESRTADLARAFDLTEALSRVVSDYSAGMTKKLMLAGALIHSPRVLVLDEPFEAVDPVSSGVILDILRAYVSHGGTVILSSHGMDLVERVCSRVAVIVGGEVLAEGTIDEVRAGRTLTERFVELSGSSGEVEGLEWLHTFSG
ncbi:ABC transporter ATP-binding protein [Microbacterium esteraromaticum]|uniref:ABC transporter ATP-binding protein n=1 Tax=Microbacterium esteraromaticum TaxID=57043 RepID=UPI0027DDDC7F|nr:ABC transporter ATP-binding protein [Microbacterium esteraromaticum]